MPTIAGCRDFETFCFLIRFFIRFFIQLFYEAFGPQSFPRRPASGGFRQAPMGFPRSPQEVSQESYRILPGRGQTTRRRRQGAPTAPRKSKTTVSNIDGRRCMYTEWSRMGKDTEAKHVRGHRGTDAGNQLNSRGSAKALHIRKIKLKHKNVKRFY